jgi:hypothetical protein
MTALAVAPAILLALARLLDSAPVARAGNSNAIARARDSAAVTRAGVAR